MPPILRGEIKRYQTECRTVEQVKDILEYIEAGSKLALFERKYDVLKSLTGQVIRKNLRGISANEFMSGEGLDDRMENMINALGPLIEGVKTLPESYEKWDIYAGISRSIRASSGALIEKLVSALKNREAGEREILSFFQSLYAGLRRVIPKENLRFIDDLGIISMDWWKLIEDRNEDFGLRIDKRKRLELAIRRTIFPMSPEFARLIDSGDEADLLGMDPSELLREVAELRRHGALSSERGSRLMRLAMKVVDERLPISRMEHRKYEGVSYLLKEVDKSRFNVNDDWEQEYDSAQVETFYRLYFLIDVFALTGLDTDMEKRYRECMKLFAPGHVGFEDFKGLPLALKHRMVKATFNAITLNPYVTNGSSVDEFNLKEEVGWDDSKYYEAATQFYLSDLAQDLWNTTWSEFEAHHSRRGYQKWYKYQLSFLSEFLYPLVYVHHEGWEMQREQLLDSFRESALKYAKRFFNFNELNNEEMIEAYYLAREILPEAKCIDTLARVQRAILVDPNLEFEMALDFYRNELVNNWLDTDSIEAFIESRITSYANYVSAKEAMIEALAIFKNDEAEAIGTLAVIEQVANILMDKVDAVDGLRILLGKYPGADLYSLLVLSMTEMEFDAIWDERERRLIDSKYGRHAARRRLNLGTPHVVMNQLLRLGSLPKVLMLQKLFLSPTGILKNDEQRRKFLELFLEEMVIENDEFRDAIEMVGKAAMETVDPMLLFMVINSLLQPYILRDAVSGQDKTRALVNRWLDQVESGKRVSGKSYKWHNLDAKGKDNFREKLLYRLYPSEFRGLEGVEMELINMLKRHFPEQRLLSGNLSRFSGKQVIAMTAANTAPLGPALVQILTVFLNPNHLEKFIDLHDKVGRVSNFSIFYTAELLAQEYPELMNFLLYGLIELGDKVGSGKVATAVKGRMKLEDREQEIVVKSMDPNMHQFAHFLKSEIAKVLKRLKWDGMNEEVLQLADMLLNMTYEWVIREISQDGDDIDRSYVAAMASTVGNTSFGVPRIIFAHPQFRIDEYVTGETVGRVLGGDRGTAQAVEDLCSFLAKQLNLSADGLNVLADPGLGNALIVNQGNGHHHVNLIDRQYLTLDLEDRQFIELLLSERKGYGTIEAMLEYLLSRPENAEVESQSRLVIELKNSLLMMGIKGKLKKVWGDKVFKRDREIKDDSIKSLSTTMRLLNRAGLVIPFNVLLFLVRTFGVSDYILKQIGSGMRFGDMARRELGRDAGGLDGFAED